MAANNRTDLDPDLAPRVEVVAQAEVSDLLGISKQRLSQLRHRDDFPRPIAELTVGAVWDADEIRAWAEDHGYPR